MNWQRAWIIAAAVLVLVAGVFLWWNNLSAAFVTAALGACAWFLSYRAQLRGKLTDTEESGEDTLEEVSDDQVTRQDEP